MIINRRNHGRFKINWCVLLEFYIGNFRLIFKIQFYPYPSFGTFTIAGESFDLMDGILGMSISKSRTTFGHQSENAERLLYFHSLASEFESTVPLRLINNASIWKDDSNAQPREFKNIGRRGVQTGGE
jgi:hypothetical protein